MRNDPQKLEEVVRGIQRLHNEFARNPTKEEIVSLLGVTRHWVDTVGCGYKNLLDLAGLPYIHHSRKVTKEIFRQPIPEEIVNKPVESQAITERILIAGDMHLPWVHEPTLEKFLAFNKHEQPTVVVQIGDLFDMYAHSRFPRSQNLYTPKDEEKRAREKADEFWFRVHQDNPTAKKYQFKGNHDIRPVKETLNHLPAIEHFVDAYMEKLFTFDNVITIHDHREIFRIDGIGFHHGYLGQLGAHRDTMLENMVVGHTHMGGVVFRGLRGRTIFELNVGLMGDPSSKVMTYTPAKEDKQTLGFGFIDGYGPRFIAT